MRSENTIKFGRNPGSARCGKCRNLQCLSVGRVFLTSREQQFKRMDKDGDKKVSCEEFVAAQKKPARKPGNKGGRGKAKKKQS